MNDNMIFTISNLLYWYSSALALKILFLLRSSMFDCWNPSILLLYRLFIDLCPFVRDVWVFNWRKALSIFSLKEGNNSKTGSLIYVLQVLSQLVLNLICGDLVLFEFQVISWCQTKEGVSRCASFIDITSRVRSKECQLLCRYRIPVRPPMNIL